MRRSGKKSPLWGNRLAIAAMAAVGGASLLLLIYSDQIWRNNFRKSVPLLDNVMHARVATGVGGLWLEKTLAGDRTIGLEMIMELFDRALQTVDSAEKGMSAFVNLPGLPPANRELLGELQGYRDSIRRARNIAEEVWRSRKGGIATNGLAKKLDSALHEVGLAAGVVDLMVKRDIREMIRRQKKVQGLTFALWLAVLGGAGAALFVAGRRRMDAEEQVRRLSQRLIKAHETERQRLSRDLHDHLAQDLATLKMNLDALADGHANTDPRDRRRLGELSREVQKSVMTVREIAYGLRPAGLDQLGLVKTVSQFCKEFSAGSGIEVDFFSAGLEKVKMDLDMGITLYRLVQEGLNNVRKHARATRVKVRLITSFPEIILRIEDDGKGFAVPKQLERAGNGKSMGIRIMGERVALLDGEMKIESTSTRGTMILVKVPYLEKIRDGQQKRSGRR